MLRIPLFCWILIQFLKYPIRLRCVWDHSNSSDNGNFGAGLQAVAADKWVIGTLVSRRTSLLRLDGGPSWKLSLARPMAN